MDLLSLFRGDKGREVRGASRGVNDIGNPPAAAGKVGTARNRMVPTGASALELVVAAPPGAAAGYSIISESAAHYSISGASAYYLYKPGAPAQGTPGTPSAGTSTTPDATGLHFVLQNTISSITPPETRNMPDSFWLKTASRSENSGAPVALPERLYEMFRRGRS